MAFASLLINTSHHSELLDWIWWRLVRSRCSQLELKWRYNCLLKRLSDRILNNLKELNTLPSVPDEGTFFSKLLHFDANATECLKSLKLYFWISSVDKVMDVFHKILPLMYKYYPGYAVRLRTVYGVYGYTE